MNTRATEPYPGFSYFPDAQGYCPNIVLPLPVEPFFLCISYPLPRRTLYDLLPAENAPQVLLSRLHNFCFSISSLPCQDSGQPPVFSAADFHPPVTAGAEAQSRTDRQISSSSCKKWSQKCPSFCKLLRRGCLFQRKRNLLFGVMGLFYGNTPLCEVKERPDISV